MHIFVSGAGGRIGTRMVDFILKKGHSVRAFDMEDLSSRFQSQNFESVIGSVLDFEAVKAAVEGCDAVAHLAGLPSPVRFGQGDIFNTNVDGTFNVVYAAGELGVDRICIASSINAIGAAYSRQPRFDYFPIDELHPSYVEEPYGLSKYLGEHIASAAARRFDRISLSSLRVHFAVDDKEQAVRDSPAQGDAVIKHLWGYVKYEAVASATLKAFERAIPGHEVYNIVAPDTISSTATLDLLQKWYPKVPLRTDIRGFDGLFDTTKAQNLLGWSHK